MSVQTQLPDPNQSIPPAGKSLPGLAGAVTKFLKLVQQQMNRLSDGSINGCTTASTSPPLSNSATLYAQGDFIRNSAPTVLGTAGSRYVVMGWVCVGVNPTIWAPCHALTGT